MGEWAFYSLTIYVWVIDQVWGQDGWILAEFFFFFACLDGVEVHKHAKKEPEANIKPYRQNKRGQ